MSFLEITLGILLLTVFVIAIVCITTLVASKRAIKNQVKQLKLDLESRDRTIAEHREEIVGHLDITADLKSQLAACVNRSEQLQKDVAGSEQQIVQLRGNLNRYATIDDAESYAANIKKAAEARVNELTQKATAIRSEAVATVASGLLPKT
jgi:uncharacterized membrane-anchored protein YhcB (DUF1043 family)